MAHLEWKTKAGQLIGLHFDSIQVIEHALSAEVTTHPVENGPDIADHIRPGLPRITLSGRVSNSPIRPTGALLSRFGQRPPIGTYRPVPMPPRPPVPPRPPIPSNAIGAGADALKGFKEPKSIEALVFDGLQSRVREVTDVLTDLLNNRQLVSIRDEAQDYDNLAITGRVVVRAAEGGKACQVQLDLEQIKIVTSATVDAPLPADVRGQGLTAAGSASAGSDAMGEAKKTQMKSIAATLFDAF